MGAAPPEPERNQREQWNSCISELADYAELLSEAHAH